MRILPVLDIKEGEVVRGVAGRRETYRPIVSRLSPSSRPVDVARLFRERFGLAELYLADLDAIAGAEPAWATYQDIHALGFRLWIDAGLKSKSEAEALAKAGVARIVAGLETVAGPDELADICRLCGGERVVFSLDLKNGIPLGSARIWNATDPWTIATQSVAAGVGSLLVLDLARVGVNTGIGTETLCRRLAATYPELLLAAGGGIRDLADLLRLRNAGIGTALLASALHDERITPADLSCLDTSAIS